MLISMILTFIIICYPYQEGFGGNSKSYILLLREPNLDMMIHFNDISKGYIAFDVSSPENLNKFMNSYKEVMFTLGNVNLVNAYTRVNTTPTYLKVETKDGKINMTASSTPPSYAFTSTSYVGMPNNQTPFAASNNINSANGIMLFKDEGSQTWTILATEVAYSEICKIKNKCSL